MAQFLIRRFIKNYQNTEDQAVRASYGKLTGGVGIFCNLVLFLAKLAAGILSGSVSITADAVNNLSDASSSLVTLLGFRIAAKPADAEHPYGHARMEYFSGLAVALIILVIGVELAKSSAEKILHPQAVEFSFTLVFVLLVSIAIKLWMAGFYRGIGKKIRSAALLAASADSRNDVLATAAVLLCCIAGKMTGLRMDGYMGLAVALFILYSGIGIAKDTIDPLLGAKPDAALVEQITQELLANPAVLGIHDLMIHDYGPGRQFASVHAEMDAKLDPLAAHEVLDELERQCVRRHHVALTIHYDPIVTDDVQLQAIRTQLTRIVKRLDSRLSVHDVRMVCGPHRTNLIFDLVVPFDLQPQRNQLKAAIDQALQEAGEGQYYTVIDFDEASFNPCAPEDSAHDPCHL